MADTVILRHIRETHAVHARGLQARPYQANVLQFETTLQHFTIFERRREYFRKVPLSTCKKHTRSPSWCDFYHFCTVMGGHVGSETTNHEVYTCKRVG